MGRKWKRNKNEGENGCVCCCLLYEKILKLRS